MKDPTLQKIHVGEYGGREIVTIHFPDFSASEAFKPGESITVTLLKLENLRSALLDLARRHSHPPRRNGP